MLMELASELTDIRDIALPSGKELVDTYQVKVFNICLSLVHNTQDAEDITQDVFIDILKNLHTFRGDAQLGTWIYRIAVNRSLNYIRSSKRRRWLGYIDEVLSFSGEQKEEPATDKVNLETREDARILREAIDALPEKQRIAFTLNKINELSYKEVAETMNVSHAAVETYIHRARLNLQKSLKKHFR